MTVHTLTTALIKFFGIATLILTNVQALLREVGRTLDAIRELRQGKRTPKDDEDPQTQSEIPKEPDGGDPTAL
ncbi:hypothetical protein [Streptomyces sp. B1-3]|uniref:hypothetical protein n=1 Tax=Streptomyces sp. B1-3 TaxID=3141453 RepID=UPI003D28FECD